MNTPHILIIDDDREINALIADYLKQHGFRVSCAFDGFTIDKLFKQHHFDMVILDVMLPGHDGLSICKKIRAHWDMPILMLSAAHSEGDKVAGLELGADDYIAKPFSSRELLARVKAHLRRHQGELMGQKKIHKLAKLCFDRWVLDRDTRCLFDRDSIATPLSQKEFDVLMLFLTHPKRILSRSQLMEQLYERDHGPFDRSIDVLIGRLRKKIELDPKNPCLLMTIRGGGYSFEAEVNHQ